MDNKHNYNGILAIDKPTGMTSFDVIRRIKKLFNMKKVGHGGTLDKDASGILPILLGEATKLFDYLLIGQKEYVAKIQFGAFTDTDDAEGQVIESHDFEFDEALIREALPQFVGEIEQIPPQYSALKINGKRSYELARQKVKVKHRARKVNVYEISTKNFDPHLKQAVLRIRCSSGTYIRSIARDLGKSLGWGAHLCALRRTQSAGLKLSDCISLESLTVENAQEYFIPFNQALNAYPALTIKVPSQHFRQGKPLSDNCFSIPPKSEGIYRVTNHNELIALIRYEHKHFKYLRIFAFI